MNIIVETGAGLSNAESWLDVAGFQAYADAHGLNYDDAAYLSIDQALRRGVTYIQGRYAGRWPGQKVNGRNQALDWPRVNVLDSDGYDVPSTSVPREILDAQAEASWRELATPGSLTPDYVGSQQIVEKTVGPITIRYSDPGANPDADRVRPTVTIIDEILYPLLLSGSGGSVRWLMRA